MGEKIILVQIDQGQNHHYRRILEIRWVEENYLSQCSGWEDEQRKVEDGKHVDAAEQPEEEEEEEGYHQPHQEETPEVADLQDQGEEEVGEGAGKVGEKPVEGEEEEEGEEGVTQEEAVQVQPEEELSSHQVEKHLRGSFLFGLCSTYES